MAKFAHIAALDRGRAICGARMSSTTPRVGQSQLETCGECWKAVQKESELAYISQPDIKFKVRRD